MKQFMVQLGMEEDEIRDVLSRRKHTEEEKLKILNEYYELGIGYVMEKYGIAERTI